ncbi:RecQ family ATP-dependent DNA helicase [Roseimaritima ulvae]|uniref:ATP-dependent DNA helicase RecQ n=1 Tax=Roseimaritima ulvae TaxID=980254 RepID=A0A5B9QLM3_9BACT|nr:ATP-dependent DNA helicase RecQ [Roseimaritima ulvae]QEG38712.1 ATP-dependent DNA helicase RecQ [Roseimaritima ulvae]
MSQVADLSAAHQLLQDRFGLDDFKPGQQAVIETLLAGRSAAAVFPTGGGKSLCYQLPSQIFEGTTLVVSPLIALMKDQCDALLSRGIPAARLDSSLTAGELHRAMQNVRDGATKILYVAPERFFNERFRAAISSLSISLFAIDEAHCISQWGHNFRPDYLKLAELTKELQVPRVLALTATATPEVLDDIRTAFDIQPADAVRTPFFRANLQLRSTILTSDRHYDTLLDRLESRPPGPTLVYVTVQKAAEEVAERLADAGLNARAYHAGMESEVRAEIQQWFLESTDGIVVATIAFGMGIDKSDIRYVYHYNPAKSLESYAQEIGRAGRDGKDSICETLLVPEDRVVLQNFTYGDTPTRAAVKLLIELIAGQSERFHVSHYRLAAETDIRILVVRTLLTYLELDGFIKATSPRYDNYQFRPFVTSQNILRNFKGEQREFVAGILSSSVRGKVWFTIPLPVTARRLQAPRERIVKAIDYMAERGWMEVKVAGLVHGFEKHNDFGDLDALADRFFDRLQQREATDIRRLDDVLQLATASSCQAATLSAHFGEQLDQTCGRCTACLGEGPFELPKPQNRGIGRSASDAVHNLRKQYPDLLDTPRAQARFLCGLSSPVFVSKRLTREPHFGVCNHIPFETVLNALT